MPRAKPTLTESKTRVNAKAAATAEMPKAKATKKGRGDGSKKKKGWSDPFVVAALALALAMVTDSQSTDPNAPKRGLSAYMFFANDQRDTVREENPGISFGIASLLPLARDVI